MEVQATHAKKSAACNTGLLGTDQVVILPLPLDVFPPAQRSIFTWRQNPCRKYEMHHRGLINHLRA